MLAEWKQSIDSEDLVVQMGLAKGEEAIARIVRQVGLILECFEVRVPPHQWNVLRSHHDIQDFILAYNLRFKAKLVFGSFMMQGLAQVCSNPQAADWPPLLQFLQAVDAGRGKIKSLRLLKKSGGRYKDYFCCRLPWQWQNRDFVITDSGVLYCSEGSNDPKEYLPFGQGFRVYKGKNETGYELGIRLQANHRKLLLYAPNISQLIQFLYFINIAQQKAVYSSGHRYRYDSFAPVRNSNKVEFLIDGEAYYRAVADALERATWQIMICGWWVSPEFQLVRPVSVHAKLRLDHCLQRAGERGVKICILVYNESSFLTNDSAYTKEALESLSPQIKVLQHPLGVLPTFWSHHQKAVIVDQSQALLGGLDLCYARYDSSSHRIDHTDPDFYPGIEYNNIRSADLVKVKEFWSDGVSRQKARLPWHDVGVRVMGDSVLDLCHHFIEYWNYASFQTHYQDRYILILEMNKPKQPFMKQIEQKIHRQIQQFKQFAGSLKKKIFQGSTDSEVAEQEGSSKVETVKKEDIRIGFKYEDSDTISSKHFQSIAKSEETWQDQPSPGPSSKQNMDHKSEESQKPLKPARLRKFSSVNELDDIVESMGESLEAEIDFIHELPPNKLRATTLHDIPQQIEQQMQCQILRSVSGWSIGCAPSLREKSICTAYIDLILSAQRFIYIENQFFISAVEGDTVAKNEVANAIFTRIAHAHFRKEPFKVWVMLPLVPGFAGELDDAEAVFPRVIMHWQYVTILRHSGSLLSRISNLGVDPKEYIQFFGLRTHGLIDGKPETEIIYLHTKLMIIDDLHAICGSANINDRSMRGSRDSELCLLTSGGQQISRLMNGMQTKVSETIHELRVKLFQQHFGEDIDPDPLSEKFQRQINQRTRNNTKLYREIFHCYPDDRLRTLSSLAEMRKIPIDDRLYFQCKDQIVGNAVEFPLLFLQDEDLLIGATLYPDALSV